MGQKQDFKIRRQAQALNQPFRALGGKNAMEPQAGTQSLGNKLGTLDPNERAHRRPPIDGERGRGLAQRPAQFFQARILRAMYNAIRHLWTLSASAEAIVRRFYPGAPPISGKMRKQEARQLAAGLALF